MDSNNKNYAWIDVETTGVNPEIDRIVQIAVAITDKDLNVIQVIEQKVNPKIPIPPGSIEVHKITDEMVADMPTFEDISAGLYNFIKDCNYGGYNVLFDLSVIYYEFERVGISFSFNTDEEIDPLKVLQKMEPRDQSSVYKHYTGKTLDNAHDAKADILATIEIARAQLAKYPEINSLTDMHNLSGSENRCDLAKKIIKNDDGVPVFNFGPHYGKPIVEEVGFLNWMLTKDFTSETKQWITNYLENIKHGAY